mmetsp:Transcript_32751/g.58677  ORF Transcript_32751/g.58677 Transcript_32751/m.58677 type:complete len:236 (-) Transcript_32751:1065-1772(-)
MHPLPPAPAPRPITPDPGNRRLVGANSAARCTPKRPPHPQRSSTCRPPRPCRDVSVLPLPHSAPNAPPPRNSPDARTDRAAVRPAATSGKRPRAPAPAPAAHSLAYNGTAPMRRASHAGAACHSPPPVTPPQTDPVGVGWSWAGSRRSRRPGRPAGQGPQGRPPTCDPPSAPLPPTSPPYWQPGRRPPGCGQGRTARPLPADTLCLIPPPAGTLPPPARTVRYALECVLAYAEGG